MIVLTSALAGHVNLLQRLVCSRAHRLASVERRALFEFHAANLRATRARTGILLFVSLMERRALVLADEAIDRRFTPDHWSTEVSMMVRGAREQRLASGIVEAVRHASELLASTFPRETDDTNELSDRPLIKDQWV
jgi:putative membrane protein